MELTTHAKGVVNITPDQLRAYMQEHPERDYVLIDVRQPEEYEAQHIPGAKLVPLMELETRVSDVEGSPETHKIFLCRSGGRSARAAGFFAERRGVMNVFNVAGGMMGWNGATVPEFPNLKAFDGKGTIAEVLMQAMDLEKGADRLYSSLLEHFEGTPQHETISLLSKSEEAHGRAVYGALRKLGQGELDDFDAVYDRLQGDILEGGFDVEAIVNAARAAASQGSISLLELAVELELRAYDVYRALAHRADDADLRETFLDLAEQEKRHARALLKTLGAAAAAA